MTADIECEIGVLGGGPAGSVVARQLAELGHDTVLVDRTSEAKCERAESLAPSIRPILESLQLQEVLDVSVFCREQRALLCWGTDDIQIKQFETAPSLLVDRFRFDEALRCAAARCGTRVLAQASARAPRRGPHGGWLVPIETASGDLLMRAKFLVDARGRRPHACVDDSTPSTVALTATFCVDGGAFGETRIEAGSDAWYWGSPLPNRRYAAAVFLDSEQVAGLRAQDRVRLYRRLLSNSRLLRDLLVDRLPADAYVRDATPRLAKDLIGEDFIRVGEAAVAIDPLSSQGIQAALLSAIQGSAAVHTILTAGLDSAAAFEFYRECQRAIAAKSLVSAARLYAAHDSGHSFWRRRSASAQQGAGQPKQARSQVALPAKLRVSQSLQIVEVPVLEDGLIRRARAIEHPKLDRPTAYFGGVALAPLIDDVCDECATEEILSRWQRYVPPRTAARIMDWMWSAGILVSQPGDRQNRVPSASR